MEQRLILYYECAFPIHNTVCSDPRTHGEGLCEVEMLQGRNLLFAFLFRPVREDRMAATSFGWVSCLTEAFALHV